jgi:hypothetical protein
MVIDNSGFEHVRKDIDAFFGVYVDGKSQSAWLVVLGDTSVHKAYREQKNI